MHGFIALQVRTLPTRSPPGFELGIKSMKPGGKRRIVVPPELGPPVRSWLVFVLAGPAQRCTGNWLPPCSAKPRSHGWRLGPTLLSHMPANQPPPDERLAKWHCYQGSLSTAPLPCCPARLQVGPATFFSAKQYEVFDVELRSVKTCRCALFESLFFVVC